MCVSVFSGQSRWTRLEHQRTQELSASHRLGPGGPQRDHQYPLKRTKHKETLSVILSARIFTWLSVFIKQMEALCCSAFPSSRCFAFYRPEPFFTDMTMRLKTRIINNSVSSRSLRNHQKMIFLNRAEPSWPSPLKRLNLWLWLFCFLSDLCENRDTDEHSL